MSINDENKKKFIEALKQKGVSSTCPMCSRKDWILAENYTPLLLQPLEGVFNLGGPMIPAISLVCKNCGHIALYSSKILANLPEEPKK